MSNNKDERSYNLFVIASPSGGGKNTIINRLRHARPEIEYSISVTTRPIGQGEKDGSPYFFVTDERFREMISGGELVEYETVHGFYYGTPHGAIDRVISGGKSMALDLDVKGALHVKEMYLQATLIFLVPPSLEVLRERLLKRKRESQATIEARLEAAEKEIAQSAEFDYVVMNDDLEQTVSEVLGIVDEALGRGKDNGDLKIVNSE